MTKRPELNRELIQKVLGENCLVLNVHRLVVEEDVENSSSRVSLYGGPGLAEESKDPLLFTGEGCGLVDALWSGLLARYSAEYPSLRSIEIASFKVQAKLATKQARDGTDAVGEVTLEIKNSEDTLFTFSDSSRSIMSSTARTVVAAVEWFVNAERAFITLYRSRQDARDRGREDLVGRYTREMSEVVKSTSYTEVIEGIKKDL